MPGILADANVERHVQLLGMLFLEESRRELWTALGFNTPTFRELGLDSNVSDLVLWQRCQQEQLVLITANRTAKKPTSLEVTIRTFGTPQSLPVITFANADRFLRDRPYAEIVADQVLEYLYDLDEYRGVGRLFVPRT